ncbi:MAG TPA: VWA domain-containing protein [Pyrinomonadaceae bacterium]|nr:VWA domain-containing protein [Pyrinomonadaceae bacterium]
MKNRMLTLSLLFCFGLQLISPVVAQQTGSQQPTSKPTGQQQTVPEADDEVVRITTKLVQVDAVITDGKGKPVTDLRPDEVQILENGKPQAVTNFSYIPLDAPPVTKSAKPDKNAPPIPIRRPRPEQVHRTIALVVDDLGLSFESAHFVRQGLRKFLDQQMQPNDLVAIIRTAGGIGALQQFTTDKRQLYAAVDKVNWTPRGRGGISAFAPITNNTTFVPGRPSSENDDGSGEVDQLRNDLFAVGTLGAINYVVRGLSQLPGRKSIVLLYDGFVTTSELHPTGNPRVVNALQSLGELANRASVVINTVDARGLMTLGLSAADDVNGMSGAEIQHVQRARGMAFYDSQVGLEDLTNQTGGLSIKNTNGLLGGIRGLFDEAGYYLIGYRPDEGTFDAKSGKRKFHKLSLKINRPGKFIIRMRNGFYGITDEQAKPEGQSGMSRIVNALISPFGSSEVDVRLTSLFANDAKLGSIMRSMLHVKASDLTFKEQPDGWHQAEFELLTYTFGDNGIVVDRLGKTHTIRVKGKAFERIMTHGFTYSLTVPIKKAGAYQLRTALKDTSSGRVGSASQFIEVPDIKKDRLTVSGIVLHAMSKQVYEKEQSGADFPRDNSDDTGATSEPGTGPSVRQFKRGQVMVYGYHLYNARINKATKQPNLQVRIRLFRNGQEVFSGSEVPFDASNQADLKRLIGAGAFQLGTEMEPGEYAFQVIATDLLTSGKHRQNSQWIDFELK